MTEETRKTGWHSKQKTAPHKGVGNATVDPIRKKRQIRAIKACLEDSKRDMALFTLGINTGLRGSDLLSLRFKDIISERDQVVNKLVVIESKTKKKRKIQLGKNPRDVLKALLPDDEDDIDDDAYLFPSRMNPKKHMTIQRLHQLVNSWCKNAKVKAVVLRVQIKAQTKLLKISLPSSLLSLIQPRHYHPLAY